MPRTASRTTGAAELAGGAARGDRQPRGNPGGELEAALTDRTAMVLWVAGSHLPPGALDLPTTVRIAHARGVPVLSTRPRSSRPLEPARFTRELGADAVAFSGGKALRGPQASGLLLGASGLHRGRPGQWLTLRAARPADEGRQGGDRRAGPGGRALSSPPTTTRRRGSGPGSSRLGRDLGGVPGLEVGGPPTNEAGQPVPRLRSRVDEPASVARRKPFRGGCGTATRGSSSSPTAPTRST